jgi:hypothetical protein
LTPFPFASPNDDRCVGRLIARRRPAFGIGEMLTDGNSRPTATRHRLSSA